MTSALLATIWLHTCLLLAAAGLVHLLLRRSAPRALERLWMVALLGGLITAPLAYLGSGTALSMPLAAAPAVSPIYVPSEPATAVVALPVPAPDPTSVAPAIQPVHTPEISAAPANPTSPLIYLAALWVGALGVLLVRTLRGKAALRATLRSRIVVGGGAWRDALRALMDRAGWTGPPVVLTSSSQLGSPIAFGRRTPEICVPTRALSELSAAERDALLAHELAHLERNDAGRRLATRFVATALLQPLGVFALRRLHDLSELRCDQRAAELTSQPRALAQCLARVAGWLQPRRVAAPAMARPGAALEHRVRTLLLAPAPRRNVVYGAILLLLVGAAAWGPRVAGADAITPSRSVPLHELSMPETTAPHATLAGELAAAEHELRALLIELRPDQRTPEIDHLVERLRARMDRTRALYETLHKLTTEKK